MFELQRCLEEPIGGFWPLSAVLYVDSVIKQDTTGFARIVEDNFFADGLFKSLFMLLELMEDLLVIGNVKACVNLLFLGVDIDADIVGRRA